MKLYVKGGNVVLPDQKTSNKTLVIEDQTIYDIIPYKYKPGRKDKVIDATGMWVVPGFIDIHAHGAMGNDTMDGTCEAIHIIGKFFASHGVTSYLPTVWTSTPDLMLKAIHNVSNCPQPEDGARHLGVHVEGPYLNVEHRGAQIKKLIKLPDPKEYLKWFDSDIVRLVTMAPEVPGSKKLIEEAVKRGIIVSIGHSGASYEQVIEAANHGISQATHLFNGMLGLHHRKPGTVGGILMDERIYAQIIADGIHLHPAIVELSIKIKGILKTVLITDSIRGAGLSDGYYNDHDQQFTVKNGIARTPEGGLSGSTLTLDRAIKNVMKFTGMSFNEVLQMATSTPAKSMGWQDKHGLLKPGADADVVLLDKNLNVKKTFVLGNEVYSK